MTRFISKRTLSLEFLGEEWKECFIKFTALSIAESRNLMKEKLSEREPGKIIDITLDLLKSHFDSGVAYDSEANKAVKLKKEDLIELPQSVLERAVLFLVGEPGSKEK